MASHKSSNSILLIFLSSLVLLIPFISYSFARPISENVTNKDIDIICSKSEDASFCWRTIKSNPLSTRINFHNLASYVLQVALEDANNSYKAIRPFIAVATNLTLREGYVLCSGHYYSAIQDLKNSQTLLRKHDYRGVRVLSLSASEEAILCERELGIPADQPSPLRKRNNNLKHYGSIIWAISNRLISSQQN